MPSGDFCYVAPWGGTPHMIPAAKLVQIAAPARSTGFGTFSDSLGSAKVFRAEPHEARYGRVKGRASGQLSLAASHARPPLPSRHTRGIPEQSLPCLRRPAASAMFIAHNAIQCCARFRPRSVFKAQENHERRSPRAARARGLRRRCRPAAPTPQSQPGLLIAALCPLKTLAPCGAKNRDTLHIISRVGPSGPGRAGRVYSRCTSMCGGVYARRSVVPRIHPDGLRLCTKTGPGGGGDAESESRSEF